jgi:hypothetical protein
MFSYKGKIMVNIVRKKDIELGNNQLYKFFESLSKKENFSTIDTEIKEQIYDVFFSEKEENRKNEKYIKEKIAEVLAKNPDGTKIKDIEELYKEYKRFLNHETKESKSINTLVDKIFSICEKDKTYGFEKIIGDENYENNFKNRI